MSFYNTKRRQALFLLRLAMDLYVVDLRLIEKNDVGTLFGLTDCNTSVQQDDDSIFVLTI